MRRSRRLATTMYDSTAVSNGLIVRIARARIRFLDLTVEPWWSEESEVPDDAVDWDDVCEGACRSSNI